MPTTLDEIQIRDPFVLHVPEQGRYFLFGSTDKNIWEGLAEGFDTYWSEDLINWHGPTAAFRPTSDFWSKTQYWAPEVHRFHNAYFMFATFTADGHRRGTQVLRSEQPEGPYLPWSDGPLTPRDWECLDGTLHVEDGTPYLVFCREWKDVGDGEIHAMPLTADLSATTEDPFLLFSASEARWARPLDRPELEAYVTDGPFLHQMRGGPLVMLWSSMGEHGYALGFAVSASGKLRGPWHQQSEPLWHRDGGHGMVFRDDADRLLLALHRPNQTPDERACFFELRETGDGIELKEPVADSR